jgi:hypothetical protein
MHREAVIFGLAVFCRISQKRVSASRVLPESSLRHALSSKAPRIHGRVSFRVSYFPPREFALTSFSAEIPPVYSLSRLNVLRERFPIPT